MPYVRSAAPSSAVVAMKPYYQDDAVTIYHGDSRDLLPLLPAVDLMATDPPYGIGDRWTKSAMVGKNGSSRLWGKGETWDDDPIDLPLLMQAVSHGRRAIVWGGNYYAMPAARCWLVWDKIQKFTGADAELAWTNFDAPVRVFRLSRVEAFANNAENVKRHPTEKPIRLMRWCLKMGTDEIGDVVLDPFMGSGTTLRAAKDLGLRAIGVEREERYCQIAAERMGQEVLDFGEAA
jgi:site-specific DNA-methyltransferase (adenine-specific)